MGQVASGIDLRELWDEIDTAGRGRLGRNEVSGH